MKFLKTGDPCPCCGQPIRSKDPGVLQLLTWISQTGRFPTMDELQEMLAASMAKSEVSHEPG